MTLFAHNQFRHSRWGRTVLSAVLIAWLTTALQPCLMAMEITSGPAASVSMSMADHGDHSSHEEMSSHCACCPAADTQSQDVCRAVLQTECEQPADYYDARTTTVKVKDSLTDIPVGVPPPVVVISLQDSPSVFHGRAICSRPPGNAPALNVLYGVYLI